jgi:hypothetical protein
MNSPLFRESSEISHEMFYFLSFYMSIWIQSINNPSQSHVFCTFLKDKQHLLMLLIFWGLA